MRRWQRTGATAVWAIAAALIVDMFLSGSVPWWHPYCDSQADGPGVSAYGLPLPYREWTTTSSLEYDVMPHIFALDLLLMALLVAPAIRLILGLLPSRGPIVGAGVLGALVLIPMILLHLLGMQGWWPVWSIASTYDRYEAYRPAALMLPMGHRACERYP